MACAFLGSVHLVLSHASSGYLGSSLCVQPQTQVTSLPLAALCEPSVTLASSLQPKPPRLHLSVARMAAPGSGFFHPQQCNLPTYHTRSTPNRPVIPPPSSPHALHPSNPCSSSRVRSCVTTTNKTNLRYPNKLTLLSTLLSTVRTQAPHSPSRPGVLE
jgi:hypothetical protein